ncbi:MAG: flagellar hook assembly protein FlgD [Spongiibacteraceae bacterium]|jgi:flagellar basal-body rod modification protein FlgD|nr:flagellar hook assembly protein FlgD [Spongiibacteraceae bacterium]
MAINDVTATSLFSELGLAKQPEQRSAPSQELGKDAFLELMITQMQNQNPLEPQTNADFVAQLAQFSSVEGITNLSQTVAGLATGFQSSQALQASAMVGRTVKIPTNVATLPEGGDVKGTIEVPYSTAGLRLNVYDEMGVLVYQDDLGSHNPGDVSFSWDGKRADGTTLPAGRYEFEVIANNNGEPEQLQTWLGANVDSVTVGANQNTLLNIAGLGPVPLAYVKEIL